MRRPVTSHDAVLALVCDDEVDTALGVAAELGVAPNTARRYLARLVERGQLVVIYGGRRPRYVPAGE